MPETDVLIVGAGPSGLFAALLLARYGINRILIVDKNPLPVKIGRAAALQPRTQEILETLGLQHEFAVGSGAIVETAFWGPGGHHQGIKRTDIGPEVTNATPFRCIITQHQGRVEEILNREFEKKGHTVRRPYRFCDYEYTDDTEHPIRAWLTDMVKGTSETWNCKYLIAADGIGSIVRQISRVSFAVESSTDSWIVADTTVQTDFPDFRRRCAIQWKHGNLMLIPSPNNTIRIYLLLRRNDVEDLEHSKIDGLRYPHSKKTNHTTLADILARRLHEVLEPYTMEIKEIHWISQYGIAQSVMNAFTDNRNVLFIGDSCHSHGPKAIQGMNAGLQDAYNLTWKLALVLRGLAQPRILDSYNEERKRVADQLVEFDTKFSNLFSSNRKANTTEFHDLWQSNRDLTSGLGIQYPPSLLVTSGVRSDIIDTTSIAPLTPGKRFLPMDLIRHINGRPINSLGSMPSYGQFREIIFAGDISREPRRSEFRKVYSFLTSPSSAISRYNGLPPGGEESWEFEDIYTSPPDSYPRKLIDLSIIHTVHHLDMEIQPDFSLWKYRIFEDKQGVEHRRHGVDPDKAIVIVLVRPDGVVSLVHGMNELGMIPEYFRGFMCYASRAPSNASDNGPMNLVDDDPPEKIIEGLRMPFRRRPTYSPATPTRSRSPTPVMH